MADGLVSAVPGVVLINPQSGRCTDLTTNTRTVSHTAMQWGPPWARRLVTRFATDSQRRWGERRSRRPAAPGPFRCLVESSSPMSEQKRRARTSPRGWRVSDNIGACAGCFFTSSRRFESFAHARRTTPRSGRTSRDLPTKCAEWSCDQSESMSSADVPRIMGTECDGSACSTGWRIMINARPRSRPIEPSYSFERGGRTSSAA